MSIEPLYNPDSFTSNKEEKNAPAPENTVAEEDLAMFKQQVAEWLKLDDQIRKLNIALRERKVHQKAIGEKIQLFMTSNNYDDLNTGQGKIRSRVRTVQQPIKISEIKKRLEELGQEEIIQKIFHQQREQVVKKSLTRIVPKVSLSLDL